MHRAIAGPRPKTDRLRKQRVLNSAHMRRQCRDKAAVRRPRQMHRAVAGRRQNLIALRLNSACSTAPTCGVSAAIRPAVRRPRQMHRAVAGRRQNLIALRTEQRVRNSAPMRVQRWRVMVEKHGASQHRRCYGGAECSQSPVTLWTEQPGPK